jgi:gliding motility-associated-like protein
MGSATKSLQLACVTVLCFAGLVRAQTCTAPGQNPSTAFPVCGTGVFSQSTVPLCGGRRVPNPAGCSPVLDDRNPFWYKFTCFKSGTLGFTIAPNSSSDYDWQIWDITNRSADEVYNNVSWVVACNWSGETGNTGTSAAGSSLIVCEGLGRPLYSAMPNLQEGNTYLMLVSHFSATQAGYNLTFGGGTASITDTTPPLLDSAVSSCSGDKVFVKLNKRMRCSSLAADGSDFALAGANLTLATGVGCATRFDTDSIVLSMAAPLPPGLYELASKLGNDGNTLLDICANALPIDQKRRFEVPVVRPTLLDSIEPVGCKPQFLVLRMSRPIACNTIAADGSDFTLTGPNAPRIEAAVGTCSSADVSAVITLRLSRPITLAGRYTISTKIGTDGNTIINNCNLATPLGSSKDFVAYDSAKATIGYTVASDCKTSTYAFFSATNHALNAWLWTTPNAPPAAGAFYNRAYAYTDSVRLRLWVSNGVCADSTILILAPGADLAKARFVMPTVACPLDTVRLADSSTGPIVSRIWRFGSAVNRGSTTAPWFVFPNTVTNTQYTIALVVTDSFGCADSLTRTIFIPGNCFIAVPTAFTPNGDGLNDYLYPVNAYKAQQLEFSVYNRYGQRIWHTTDWTKKWNGTVNGNPQGAGVFAWKLNYFDPDRKKSVSLSGTSTLIR